MLGGIPLEQHFVATLVTQIEQAIEPHHQSVRVCLSCADSYGYQTLLGGSLEADEVNPAMGLRGFRVMLLSLTLQHLHLSVK